MQAILPPLARISAPRQRGFSLVEMLVGIVIALIGIVIMFQVLDNSERRKRTAGSGSDTQISGSIAAHMFERDLRIAGFGFGGAASMGCTVNAFEGDVRGAAFTFPLAPVVINDGAGGGPDQVIVLFGGATIAPGSYAFSASTAVSKKMATTTGRGGIQVGDLAIVAGTGCGLIEVTGNDNADQLTIDHAVGAYTDASNVNVTAQFNAPAGFTTPSGQYFSLGNRDSARRNIWSIDQAAVRQLQVADDLHSSAASVVGEGVIDLQAEYGLDTDNDLQPDVWQTAAPAPWTQLVAIRFGMLVRGQHFEKEVVSNAAPAWLGGNFVMTNVDGGADTNPGDANDWRHYRYRVFQGVVPLRNVLWR